MPQIRIGDIVIARGLINYKLGNGGGAIKTGTQFASKAAATAFYQEQLQDAAASADLLLAAVLRFWHQRDANYNTPSLIQNKTFSVTVTVTEV